MGLRTTSDITRALLDRLGFSSRELDIAIHVVDNCSWPLNEGFVDRQLILLDYPTPMLLGCYHRIGNRFGITKEEFMRMIVVEGYFDRRKMW